MKHDFKISNLGLGVCKRCGAHMTNPQFPLECILPHTNEELNKKQIADLRHFLGYSDDIEETIKYFFKLFAEREQAVREKVEKYFTESIEIQNKCNPKNSLKIAMLEDDKREVLLALKQ